MRKFQVRIQQSCSGEADIVSGGLTKKIIEKTYKKFFGIFLRFSSRTKIWGCGGSNPRQPPGCDIEIHISLLSWWKG